VNATRTLLLQTARTETLKVVMITSASAGEGKTSLATHLAASLAQIGHRTLLIDGDLRNPTAHSVFELPSQPGLSDILRGELELEETIRATPIDSLWMIPAGRWDRQTAKALAQERIGDIFRRLREQFDFILVDSSPVLPVTDPLLIGQHADAVLLSVLCGISRMAHVHEAYQRLTGVGLRTMGVVVNGVRLGSYGSAYSYEANAEVNAGA
jgi:capsular exopolysaccharide synthesis family protein